MEKINNQEELEKVKKQYNNYIKIIKIICVIILIVLGIILIKNIYRFVIVNKIVNANVCVDLGDNYKVTFYDIETNQKNYILYYKNNIKKENTEDCQTFYTPKGMYVFFETNKVYSFNSDDVFILMSSLKNNFLTSEMFADERILKLNVIKSMMNKKYKIGKEEFQGEEYVTLDRGYYKYWLEKENYILKFKKTADKIEKIEIEKNVVTDEDIALPNLNEYEKMNGSE